MIVSMSEDKENANNQNEVVSTEISALDVAKYLIGLAQRDGKPVTNLRLQKLLYYAWGTYWNLYRKILFKDDIEAWQFGPVVRDVYIEYCDSKKQTLSIKERDFSEIEKKLNIEIKKFLTSFYQGYKDLTTNSLVSSSHEEKPWKTTYKGKKTVIPIEKLKDFFNDIEYAE